jgi:hypothetical protein
MSSYSGINQLLEEMGTSDRSAGDPWTITHGSSNTASGSSFSPAIVGDLGAPAQELTSEMQSAEQIARADEVVTSPVGQSQNGSSKSTTGNGILGGVLSLFPIASVVGKLFGLGGSSSPAPLTPYIQPPSVNFEGAMSSTLSGSTEGSLSGTPAHSSGAQQSSSSFAPGISSLSYGAGGLPRTAVEGSQPATTSQPQQPLSTSQDAVGQVNSLTSSKFVSQPAPTGSLATGDVAGNFNESGGGGSSSTFGVPSTMPQTSFSNSPQGQSILVQVQAIDSQSFMDHSNDIAAAVRQAMLNMHSVNDVIADL